MEKPRWYDNHVTKGNLINVVLIIFFAGVIYGTFDQRMAVHQTRLDDHSERVRQVERLQISMAEVILRQEHTNDQVRRVEDRLVAHIVTLQRRLDRLEGRVHHRPPPDD